MNRATRISLCGALAIAGILAGALGAHGASVGVSSKGLGATSLAVTITTGSLTAVADTYANQASPTANTGTATTMNVQSGTSSNQRSFVRFDLSAIPTTARVQTATLQLRMSTAPTASRTYEVDRVLASWGETTLTWNTMPSSAAATASTTSGTTSGVNLTWNVTPDVKTFVASSASNFGWQVKDTVESSSTTRTAVFRTRQWTTASQRPTLTVIYAT